jgi:hypothetical protein
MSNKFVSREYKSYMFTCGMEFSRTMIHTAGNKKSTELKVWEEPAADGVYCFGVDPAFGENEKNDRASIQVGRCYADGIDQVAEFASPMPTPQQLAWILSALMGWYAGSKADVRYILELNGPGNAVFNELKQLRFQLENGYQPKEGTEQGLKNIFRNVRSFIYSRPDGMASGQNYHFKTNLQLKIMIMNHLRDYVTTGVYRIRSAELIEEMRSVAQDGDEIKAPGAKKDDRVLAAALMTYHWQQSIRKQLITQNRSREAEAAKAAVTIEDQIGLFRQNMLQNFFQQKQQARVRARIEQQRMAWRHR